MSVNGLGPRAEEFLRAHAGRVDVRFDPAEDRRAAELAERAFHVDPAVFGEFVTGLRAKFAGLRYRSHSWSFEEDIVFEPQPDVDEDDPEPMVSLVRHTVAHPFGVWVGISGTVWFLCPGEWDGDYVAVFPRVESLIESDALHAESRGWRLVAEGRAESFDAVARRASTSLAVLPEASGDTESWYEADGVRVHLWRTWAEVFQQEHLARWAVWARDEDSVESARSVAGR